MARQVVFFVLGLCILTCGLSQPIVNKKSAKGNFVRPVYYMNDQVRDKRSSQLQDDALDFYNDGEEMVDLILPSNNDNYPDDEFFLNDLKLDSTDEVAAPEGSGVESGEGSAVDFESGAASAESVSGNGESASQFRKDNESKNEEATNTEKSRTCCLIE